MYLIHIVSESRHLVSAIVQCSSSTEHGEKQHPRREHITGRVTGHGRDVFRSHVVHARLHDVRDVGAPLLEGVVGLTKREEKTHKDKTDHFDVYKQVNVTHGSLLLIHMYVLVVSSYYVISGVSNSTGSG